MPLKKRNYFSLTLAYVIITCIIFFVSNYVHKHHRHQVLSKISTGGRHLMSTEVNCTPRSIDEFPPDLFTLQQKKQGAILLHALTAIYLFCGLAVICDDYFVASLEKICEVMGLKPDVAGATFMAAGSSAPELFTSVIGVFIAQSDVGVSTIVGSAVFNILCIVALVGIFGGGVVYLTCWPLVRDSVYYGLSVAALIGVMSDSKVTWYEATIFLIMYVVYIVIMYFNEKLETFALQFRIFRSSHDSLGNEHAQLVSSGTTVDDYSTMGKDEVVPLETKDEEENDSFESPFEIPESFFKRIYWVFMLPITTLVFLTVPDCRRPGIWRRLFFLTFILSILWIAGMSYMLVWMVCAVGDTMEIPDTIMGLTILAAGTSVPDALSSVFVARDGYGDMAVSNSIGSNIFDILLCLGLPWLLRTLINNDVVYINSSGLVFSAITLLTTVALLIISVMVNKWRLNKVLGFVFFGLYIIVITFSCLYELDVFDNLPILPPCPRKNL